MTDRWWIALPLPRFIPKGCADDAHLMRRVPGKRCWVCVDCGKRRPFNLVGDE